MQISRSLVAFATVLLATVGAVVSSAPPAAAQKLPTPVIMVVDTQLVMRDSTAVKDLQQQAETQRTQLEQQAKSQEEGLRTESQDLTRQRTVLSAEAFAQKRQQLEQKYAKFQYDISSKLDELDARYSRGISQVEVELVKIADQLAAERGANMVLPKTTLLLVHKDFEVTSEVLTRLNRSLPKMPLPTVPAKK